MMILADLLIRITREILNPLIVLVFLLAVVAFGWGMVMYLSAQGSDEKVQKGKKIMWFGIIGMFVLLSMWGVVFLLCDFFGTCPRTGFLFFGSSSKGGSSSYRIDSPGGSMMIDPGNGAEGIIDSGSIDCSVDITEMTDAQCNYCYPGGLSCSTALTPTEQTGCLNNQARCEPCLHFLDEGNPRAYVKCVKNILGF